MIRDKSESAVRIDFRPPGDEQARGQIALGAAGKFAGRSQCSGKTAGGEIIDEASQLARVNAAAVLFQKAGKRVGIGG